MRSTLKLNLIALMLGIFAGTNGWALTWYWSNPAPHGNDVAALAYFNGLTIQAADFGQLYTSDDLVLWVPRVTNTTNSLQSATVFGNQVMVTGANGTVLYSPDGINYTCTNLGTTNWLVAVAASSNLLVAVGDNAVIYTSADGAHWALQPPPPGVGGDWLQGVAYGDGRFVAVGDDGYIATSVNGTNWTQRSSAATGDLTYVGWIDVAGGTGILNRIGFAAVSDAGELIASADGITWETDVDFPATTNVLYTAVGNADSRAVAGDDQLTLNRSSIGWVTNNASVPLWTYFCGLWETNPASQYLISGEDGFTAAGAEPTNVYVWSELDDSNRSWLWQMTTNAGLYIAVGDNASIMTSDDGVNWDTEAIPYTNGVSVTNTVLFGVGGSTNQLVAVGNGGTVILSTNQFTTVVTTNTDGTLSTNTVSTIGVVWFPIPPLTTNDLHGVAFFNNEYYVSGGNGSIFQSPDGLSWTSVSTPTTAYISSMTPYSDGMVAVGDTGLIMTSANGTSWAKQTSPTTNWVFRVRNLGGTLIAVGEGGIILTSTNGVNWASQNSGTTNWLNDTTMVTNTFYIVGDYGTILASTNATTWTNVPIITGESLFSAATMDGQLVVAGDSGVILQSQAVPMATDLQFLDFACTTNEALFLVAPTNSAVDLQFTLDSTTNLPHWATGSLLDLTAGSLLFYEPLNSNLPPSQFYRATLLPQ